MSLIVSYAYECDHCRKREPATTDPLGDTGPALQLPDGWLRLIEQLVGQTPDFLIGLIVETPDPHLPMREYHFCSPECRDLWQAATKKGSLDALRR